MKLILNKNLPEDFNIKEAFGFIYLITNIINSKIYVGQTINFARIKKYINGHCGKGQRYLYSALQKYGKENFTIEIIDCACNIEVLNFLENFYIKTLKSNDREIGYNIRVGGDSGGPLGDETKYKIRIALTGNKIWEGKKHKSESIEKMKLSHSGKKRIFSEEHIKNINKSREKFKRKVLCVTTNTIYESLKDAAIKNNTSIQSIYNCCSGKIKSSGKLPEGTKIRYEYVT